MRITVSSIQHLAQLLTANAYWEVHLSKDGGLSASNNLRVQGRGRASSKVDWHPSADNMQHKLSSCGALVTCTTPLYSCGVTWVSLGRQQNALIALILSCFKPEPTRSLA